MDAELRERIGTHYLTWQQLQNDSHTITERKLQSIPSFTLKHIGHRHLLESVKVTKGLIYVLQERHLVMTEEWITGRFCRSNSNVSSTGIECCTKATIITVVLGSMCSSRKYPYPPWMEFHVSPPPPPQNFHIFTTKVTPLPSGISITILHTPHTLWKIVLPRTCVKVKVNTLNIQPMWHSLHTTSNILDRL